MPRQPPVQITGEHMLKLKTYVANHRGALKCLSAAQFEIAVRDYAIRKFNLKKVPNSYRTYITQLRFKMTDIRTFDESLAATQPKRKERSHFGLRSKRPKPSQAVVLFGGKPLTFDDEVDTTTDLKGMTYPTFGKGGDLQILTSDPLPSEPPKVFLGPIFPFGYEKGDDLSLFSGPMVLSPTGIQPPQSGWKEVPWQTINAKRLKTWTGRRREDWGGQQFAIMGSVSAATEAKYAFQISSKMPVEAKKLEDNDWEWLHLVAFSMGGIEGIPQQASNLVAGTYHANTEMMLYENAVKKLIEDYKEPLDVSIKAHLIMHTHTSDRIVYTIRRNVKGGTERTCTLETNPLAFFQPASGLERMTYLALEKILFL